MVRQKESCSSQKTKACRYLPAFITAVFHGMPGVWKGQHRLVLCWLIMMQAVYPGQLAGCLPPHGA